MYKLKKGNEIFLIVLKHKKYIHRQLELFLINKSTV